MRYIDKYNKHTLYVLTNVHYERDMPNVFRRIFLPLLESMLFILCIHLSVFDSI